MKEERLFQVRLFAIEKAPLFEFAFDATMEVVLLKFSSDDTQRLDDAIYVLRERADAAYDLKNSPSGNNVRDCWDDVVS